jgi:mono/diheme cytochrome c family protein
VKSFLLLCALALPAYAHDPITTTLTWSKEISRLVYAHCAECHRPDAKAMSLLTYEEARPWAKAIRDQVANRRMPPWDAVKGFGVFRDDPSLSQAEIDLLVAWVEGGAPEGNPDHLPSRPLASTPASAPAPARQGIVVAESTILSTPLTVRALRPQGAVELSAILPDRRVEHVLWIPTFHSQWNRTYTLRSPLRLPKGTRLILRGAAVELR